MSVNCGKAQVSGAQITASTPAWRNMPAHHVGLLLAVDQQRRPEPRPPAFRRACGPSRRTWSATMPTMLAARWRDSASIRGSPVPTTPNVTVLDFASGPSSLLAFMVVASG